jgi:glycosyltransferase involved in cell wall biosynthesis
MKVLWICGLPRAVQREALGGRDAGAYAEWSWILGHLPPPPDVELHIACGHHRHAEHKIFPYHGAHFHLVPVRSRARLYFLFRFDWLFFRELYGQLKPDIIHGWGTEDAHGLIALRLNPQRHVVEVQGNLKVYRQRTRMPWQSWLAAWSERMVLARARCVAAENEYSLGAAQPMIRTKSVYAIDHPVRSEFLEGPPSDGEARHVLFLGNVEDRTGARDAVEAFCGAPPDWTMTMVGSGRPDQESALSRCIRAAGGEGRVRHQRQLSAPEIVVLMQASSIFLLPTRIDTGPTALKEALAMGLWPVCYDNSGPGHYVRKFQFGNLAADLDVEALTRTLRECIARGEWKTSVNRSKIGAQIRPHFNRARIWPELMRMYREVRSSEDGFN